MKVVLVLALLAFAGVAAGGGLGSAPAPGNTLRIAGVRATFHTGLCKPKQKKHCIKPKPVKPRTVTVTRMRTTTETETTVQSVTATQTVTVTAAAPVAPPSTGGYSGLTQNFGSLSFVVVGSPGALVVQQIGINEVDSTCTDSSGDIAHLAIYDISFPNPAPLDALGRFSASGTAKWDNGDTLTVTFSGVVANNYTANGTVSSSGEFSDSGEVWSCSNNSTWKALLG